LPFGNVNILTADIENNLRFSGQYFDAETGLHYNWNRYYDPETGRYIAADPIGLGGGMNLYAYVGSDPVNWYDSTGLFPCSAVPAAQCRCEEFCKKRRGVKSCELTRLGGPISPVVAYECHCNDEYPVCEDHTEPVDQKEALALEEAKAGAGEPFMGDRVNDPNYKDTHDKMRHNHAHSDGTNTEIHYWKDRKTGETSGFKIKGHPSCRR
ncbi:MAG: RHS repeat-associated core domain-containing protein, partial [Candidatus Electrothrix sp. ATG2]|nr:RHS repeat-associated core domain-containing protein [Candidatus Electrothrix sp. ATG2]